MTNRELLDTDWSYFPEGGRYGLLAVAGWHTAAINNQPGVTLAIVDLANCSRVVKSRRSGRKTLLRSHVKFCQEIDALNDADASVAA